MRRIFVGRIEEKRDLLTMRVGIDGGCWANRRGYGRFLHDLVGALVEERRHEYTIFLDEPGYRAFPHGSAIRPVLVRTSKAVGDAAAADGRRSLPDLLRFGLAAAREPIDIFFYPTVYSYFPLPRRVPILLGVHDTMADRFPELAFASKRQQQFWNWKVRLALRQADAVLTVSQYAKRSIQEFHRVPPDRIHTMYEGPSRVFRSMDVPPPAAPFVLAVGGLSPNKNLETLLRAFALILRQRPDCRLIIVGDYESDHFKSSYHSLAALARQIDAGDRIQFTGYIADEELVRLYNQASVLAFPSLEEGFGLPAVEAMACGLPVVASNAHALAEIVGDAGLLVDGRDESALAEAILRILGDPVLAADLRERSLARSTDFSWRTAARQLESILGAMGGSK